MNIFITILFLIVNVGFLAAYTVNFILCLRRDIKAKNKLKSSPLEVEGTVKEIESNGKRIFMLVDFISPKSLTSFTHQFEFTPNEINMEDYHKGSKVTILYNDVTDEKKVLNFPFVLKGNKIKLEKGPLFTNLAMMVVSLYGTINHLVRSIIGNAFTDNSVSIEKIYGNYLYPFIIVLLYAVLMTYLIDSLTNAPKEDNQNYLKIYGVRAKARVVTFKFGRGKNQKGLKESMLEIEYYTKTGEKINTRLNSFLYTETQEEYIDIIYDDKQPKNVVYLKA